MKGNNNSSVWLQAGYDLVAREGMEGLQVERLARIVGLSKSGFYHFFGDQEGYCNALLTLHEKIAIDYIREMNEIRTIEPDYLNLLVKYKTPVMFQLYITRNNTNVEFRKVVEQINQKQDSLLNPAWCDYLEVDKHSDLGIRYFNIVRDTFYSRVTFQNYSYQFLLNVLSEARTVLNYLNEQKNVRVKL